MSGCVNHCSSGKAFIDHDDVKSPQIASLVVDGLDARHNNLIVGVTGLQSGGIDPDLQFRA